MALDILTRCTALKYTLPLDTSVQLLSANALRKRFRVVVADTRTIALHLGNGPASEIDWNLAILVKPALAVPENRTFFMYEEPQPGKELWRGAVFGYTPTGGPSSALVTEWE